MSKHTTRDRIWSAALKTAAEHEGKSPWGRRFQATDVLEKLDNGASARSVRDTLATMADLGHIERGSAQGRYEPIEKETFRDRNDSSGSSSTSTTGRKESSVPSTSPARSSSSETMSGDDAALAMEGDVKTEELAELTLSNEERDDLEDEEDEEDVQEDSSVDVSELDLPGAGSTLEARRDAVRACYEFLRENGTATRADFEEHVYPDHPGAYQGARSWWNRVGLEGLRDLADQRDDVQPPVPGGRTWTYEP